MVAWHNSKRVTKIVSSLPVAKEIEAKIKAELVSGEYYDRKKKVKEEIKFEDFFYNIYLPYAKQNKKTWKDDDSLYRNWIKNIIGSKQIDKTSQIDFEKIKQVMSESHKSQRTIEKTLKTAKHIFNIAKNLGYFSGDNPLLKVKSPKPNNKRMRFLSKEEASSLLEETKKVNSALYEMCAISLYCGLEK